MLEEPTHPKVTVLDREGREILSPTESDNQGPRFHFRTFSFFPQRRLGPLALVLLPIALIAGLTLVLALLALGAVIAIPFLLLSALGRFLQKL